MWQRIIGVIACGWGGYVFYILSTTPLSPEKNISLPSSAEFTIFVLSLIWLFSSLLVKVGLILNKRWVKIAIVSCVCFFFLLLNMSILQKNLPTTPQSSLPQQETSLYALLASWFVGWFWIDTFIVMLGIFDFLKRKQGLSP